MRLPAALQPWQAWLTWFAPDLSLAIGSTLLRLNTLIGDYRGRAQSGAQEPNGIDDLRQRGPYHRLVLSEWALADELPEEFMRRAASGEHLFLAPRLEAPRHDGLTIALFDCGPAQLGASRLVHVALWILLARRAEQAGIQYAWGTLKAPGVLHESGSPQLLKQLLTSRTLDRCTNADVDAWEAWLSQSKLPRGERWLVGSGDDSSTTFSHRVRIRRGLSAELAVLISSSGARRETQLPLPAARATSRLLRGAFAHEVVEHKAHKAAGKLSLQQPPLIGPEGHNVAISLLGENSALIFELPRNGQAGSEPKKVQWASNSDLICAVLSAKRFGGIIADSNYLHFWKLDGFRAAARPPGESFLVPPGQARWRPCIWLNGGGKKHWFYLLDQAGRLLGWSTSDAQRGVSSEMPELQDEHVIAIARCEQDRMVYARYGGQMLELILKRRSADGIVRLGHSHMPRKPDKVFITGSAHGHVWRGAWCAPATTAESPDHASMWSIFENTPGSDTPEESQVSVMPGWQVVGITQVNQGPGSRYALVALRKDRKSLVTITPAGSETLYSATSPISTVSIATDCDLVALVTEKRELVLLSRGGGRPQHWAANGDWKAGD